MTSTHNVVDAARRAGVGKVALMSLIHARPNCASPCHESKFADSARATCAAA